jgi:hypothetical protein
MTVKRKIRAYVEIPTYPVNLEHSILFAMTIANISLSGCFIKTDQWLDIGTPISFNLPAADGKMLDLQGTVVRQQSEPHGYGINFEAMWENKRRELALLIADSIEPSNES